MEQNKAVISILLLIILALGGVWAYSLGQGVIADSDDAERAFVEARDSLTQERRQSKEAYLAWWCEEGMTEEIARDRIDLLESEELLAAFPATNEELESAFGVVFTTSRLLILPAEGLQTPGGDRLIEGPPQVENGLYTSNPEEFPVEDIALEEFEQGDKTEILLEIDEVGPFSFSICAPRKEALSSIPNYIKRDNS